VWSGLTVFMFFSAILVRSCSTEPISQLLPNVSYSLVRWFRLDSQELDHKCDNIELLMIQMAHITAKLQLKALADGCPHPAIVTGGCMSQVR
jgi:hypothetical protein